MWYNSSIRKRRVMFMLKRVFIIIEVTLIMLAFSTVQESSIGFVKYEPIVIVVEAIENQYYDIPISETLQDYTREESESRNVPYELVLAVMEVESNFVANAISPTYDYGLMQINRGNHGWLRRTFGFEDIMDERNNITSGVYMMSTLYNKYGDIHKTLMAYNYGEPKAKEYWAKGIVQSEYSKKVVEKYETY